MKKTTTIALVILSAALIMIAISLINYYSQISSFKKMYSDCIKEDTKLDRVEIVNDAISNCQRCLYVEVGGEGYHFGGIHETQGLNTYQIYTVMRCNNQQGNQVIVDIAKK